MFINNFDPVAFLVFSFEIRWYSLAYIFGILIGWYLSKKFFIDNEKIKETFDDYITYVILGIILGGSCLLYTSPSPRDRTRSRMPSSA